jgi:pyridoxal phosphate enzyme (YggS family)
MTGGSSQTWAEYWTAHPNPAIGGEGLSWYLRNTVAQPQQSQPPRVRYTSSAPRLTEHPVSDKPVFMNEPAPNLTTTIQANLRQIRDRIEAAAQRAGRDPSQVTLVAVSKTHPLEAARAALQAGQLHFGENRVQEAASKFPALRQEWPGLRLHIIGGLQTNKAREAVKLADVIETLDRLSLADAIAKAITQEGRTPQLLVQVNVGDEPQKSGIPTAEADDFIQLCQARFGAALAGLMCIPPAEGDPAPHFDWLAERAARHRLGIVSMGMSGDFETAIAHGATHVRVGSAIFGHRA